MSIDSLDPIDVIREIERQSAYDSLSPETREFLSTIRCQKTARVIGHYDKSAVMRLLATAEYDVNRAIELHALAAPCDPAWIDESPAAIALQIEHDPLGAFVYLATKRAVNNSRHASAMTKAFADNRYAVLSETRIALIYFRQELRKTAEKLPAEKLREYSRILARAHACDYSPSVIDSALWNAINTPNAMRALREFIAMHQDAIDFWESQDSMRRAHGTSHSLTIWRELRTATTAKKQKELEHNRAVNVLSALMDGKLEIATLQSARLPGESEPSPVESTPIRATAIRGSALKF